MRKIINYILKIVDYTNILIVFSMLSIITLQIISRSFFNSPFDWPEEVSQLLLIFIVFLGASLIEKNDDHVKVEYIYTRISNKSKNILKYISKIFSLIIVWKIILGEIETFPRIVDLKSKAARIPYTWIHTIIIIGTLLWGVAALYRLVLLFKEEEL